MKLSNLLGGQELILANKLNTAVDCKIGSDTLKTRAFLFRQAQCVFRKNVVCHANGSALDEKVGSSSEIFKKWSGG